MATSGTVGTTTFSTLKVIDQAFRRCRLPAQVITAEMHEIATDVLHLLLSEIANVKAPSWCIAKALLPMYAGDSTVSLPAGTVDILNANYRTMSELSGTETGGTTTYTIAFSEATTVKTVSITWSGAPVALSFQTSADNATWTTVETQAATAALGDVQWVDIEVPVAALYFRVYATATIPYSAISFFANPQEVPLGRINRDTHVSYPDKTAQGRPVTYWFQRDLNSVLHLWRAPDATAAASAQLVIWYHRHIMDVGTLQQEIEIPQRWYEAIVASLAARLAEQTPQVDINLVPILTNRALTAMNGAWTGDNDGSSTFYQPQIACYTR